MSTQESLGIAQHKTLEGTAMSTPEREALAEFQEGQWWLEELDKAAENGPDDLKRAVAVVRKLLRTARAVLAQPAQEPTLTIQQRVAIELWLEYGEQLFRDGLHTGYYSGQGWAAVQLRSLLAAAPAQSAPEPVANSEDMYAVWLLGYKQGKDEAAAPPAPAQPEGWITDVYRWIESTCPQGSADEAFRVAPNEVREAIAAADGAQGDDTRKCGAHQAQVGTVGQQGLNAAPPAPAQPLTDEQIDALWSDVCGANPSASVEEIVREFYHTLKGQT